MFQSIRDMIQKRLSFLKPSHRGSFEMNPYRDWIIILGFVVISGVVFVAIAVYLFFFINSNEGAGIEAVSAGTSGVVRVEELNEALELFSAKESEFKELFETRPNIVDPSL